LSRFIVVVLLAVKRCPGQVCGWPELRKAKEEGDWEGRWSGSAFATCGMKKREEGKKRRKEERKREKREARREEIDNDDNNDDDELISPLL